MSACWASCLGGCSAKISGEHVISQAFFDASDTVKVHGLHWCMEEPKQIGMAAATANILCTTHNAALSPLDAEIGKFMRAIREHNRLTVLRQPYPKTQFPLVRLEIDGILIERWLLKTMLNIVSIERDATAPMHSCLNRPDIAGVAFGTHQFREHGGVYFCFATNGQMAMPDEIKFTPVSYGAAEPGIGLFEVAGWKMLLNLNDRVPPQMGSINGLDEQWHALTCIRQFPKLLHKNGKYASHSITFKWA